MASNAKNATGTGNFLHPAKELKRTCARHVADFKIC
jgi:hypothetical protein